MKTCRAPAAAAASRRFRMSRSTAGQSFHVTGPVQAGRFWNGGANCRAISVHSGNSVASGSRHGGYPIPTMAVTVARSSVVVGAVWVTLAIASGLYFSFPVFFVALIEEFGWSRGATAAAFSISSVVQGALSPPIGMLVDRLGPRRVMLYGAWVLGVACILSSLIGSLWTLYLVVGVLAAIWRRAVHVGRGG